MFCQGDLMAEDHTRHQEKWVKAVVWMVTKVWKGSLMLARFWAWQSTKGNVLADNFRLGLAAIVCFLWLSDLCVTQTARGTSASECLSSSPHVSLSLSLHCYSLYVYPPSSTRGEKLLERFGNLWRWSWTWRIKWSVSKIKGRSCQKNKNWWKATQWLGRRNKQTGRWRHRGSRHRRRAHEWLPIQSQSLYPTMLGRRTNPTILKERICQITGARWMHPCNVLEWKQIHWKKMRCGLGRDDEVWDWWKSTDGETDTKRRQMKTMDETRPKSDKLSCSMYQRCWLRWCKNLSLCHRFSALPFMMERQLPSIYSVQKLWKFRKPQYNEKVVNVPVVVQRLFPTIQKKKEARLSPPGSRVKSQIACVVKIVLWELRLERKHRSMSCHVHYLLFSF